MAEIIVITSGKGGVGKTTVAAHLGTKLAAVGKRTIVCDLDFGLNNLDVIMGTESKVQFDLTDALEGRCRAGQALIPCQVKNLYMISSSHYAGGGVATGEYIRSLFDGLKSNFDYVLLDCPAGIDAGFHRAMSAADSVIVVVTPALSSIRDADKTLAAVRAYEPKRLSLVVNMVRGDLAVDGLALPVKSISEILDTKVIGVIPYDDGVLTAENCYTSGGAASDCFKRLAAAVAGGRVRLYDPEKEYKGLKGSIKRRIKRIV